MLTKLLECEQCGGIPYAAAGDEPPCPGCGGDGRRLSPYAEKMLGLTGLPEPVKELIVRLHPAIGSPLTVLAHAGMTADQCVAQCESGPGEIGVVMCWWGLYHAAEFGQMERLQGILDLFKSEDDKGLSPSGEMS